MKKIDKFKKEVRFYSNVVGYSMLASMIYLFWQISPSTKRR